MYLYKHEIDQYVIDVRTIYIIVTIYLATTITAKPRNKIMDPVEPPIIPKSESVFTRYLELNNQMIKRRTLLQK